MVLVNTFNATALEQLIAVVQIYYIGIYPGMHDIEGASTNYLQLESLADEWQLGPVGL